MAKMETKPMDALVWQGRSGRLYHGTHQQLDRFVLSESEIHLLLADTRVLWVGSGADLIADPASRDRFRHALEQAKDVIRLRNPGDDSARLSILVDLEGGQPPARSSVQAA